jgi:hypothetical protein
MPTSRREFLRSTGLSAAALPFAAGLPGLGFANHTARKQRLVVVFSPNGIVQKRFWPDAAGPLTTFKDILTPLEPFKAQTLTLHGVCDKVKGDGDNHMRGIGCLLTGTELFPGNIQGGSHTPAGWAKGHSIDQELKAYLQKNPATRTRFGSLEFGALVPDRADTWTRMVYAGGNQPIAPIDDPYQMFKKLYGGATDRELLGSVLDDVADDLKALSGTVAAEDRRLLEQHTTFVREMERELKEARKADVGHAVPKLEDGLRQEENDQLPRICKAQLDLMTAAFQADFTRIATFQITNSVGQARMRWLGITDDHHNISHEPDSNADAVEKLVKINRWYCEQVAYLAKRLADTPEPGGSGSMLDHTTIVWTNELGQGNSHTLNDIPFVLVGGGLGFKTGQAIKYGKGGVAHQRLLMSLAHAFGHRLPAFGSPNFCGDGPLNLG